MGEVATEPTDGFVFRLGTVMVKMGQVMMARVGKVIAEPSDPQCRRGKGKLRGRAWN